MDKILKSFVISIVGILITLISGTLLIRIIPYFGKFVLFIGLGMILLGFFSFIFAIFDRRK
ncbi:hypothetical protein [Flavobacterium marginilacus]|uniref:hypothetical protein n=1 Tax=Flavobacterium marginilacus TaxID=3003256 RepID=UPI00248E46E2|nr:hypothetical protein [Flavobacterium marginilacus]